VPRLKNNPQILALSAGGEDGAFGAGALCGWSQTGTRPDFDIVTGVSTGALIAPLAFVGQSGDDALRHMFLDHDAHDIMTFRGLGVATSDGLYDTTPLAELIETYTPDALLQAVARKHDAGGRLFVVTADLATSNAVVWNMGEIAKAGQYELFRTVIRASGALPGLFSPVKLRYVEDGRDIIETHVDGGIQMQLLATPAAAFTATGQGASGGHGYIIVNNTLDPAPEATAQSVLGVGQQALTAMVRSSASASVNTARLLARSHGIGLSVTSVGTDSGVVYDPSDRFSATYMLEMFNHGFERATSGQLWQA
jgi:predicted acylesterase/phospholipase RssA